MRYSRPALCLTSDSQANGLRRPHIEHNRGRLVSCNNALQLAVRPLTTCFSLRRIGVEEVILRSTMSRRDAFFRRMASKVFGVQYSDVDPRTDEYLAAPWVVGINQVRPVQQPPPPPPTPPTTNAPPASGTQR